MMLQLYSLTGKINPHQSKKECQVDCWEEHPDFVRLVQPTCHIFQTVIVWLNPCPHRLSLLAYYELFGWDEGSHVCFHCHKYFYSSAVTFGRGVPLGSGMESVLEKSLKKGVSSQHWFQLIALLSFCGYLAIDFSACHTASQLLKANQLDKVQLILNLAVPRSV